MDEFITFITNPENTEYIIKIIDAVIFLFFAIAVFYLLLFAIKSMGKSQNDYPPAGKEYRFAILFPAYKEDSVIINSIKSFLTQKYPREKYDIIVIADQMDESTNKELENLSAIVVKVDVGNSSKTKALQKAIDHIETNKLSYDIIVTLDADNIVDPNFLEQINNAFYSGCSAVQTHRVAKNMNTSMALLDAVSEEINNSIFRKGHTRLGFSSSLIGSGMAFEYDIFKECISHSSSIGVDKQLELLLLKQNIYIEYLGVVYTYDEKIKKSSQFYNQRRRWISNQFYNLFYGLKSLPLAMIQGNWDYCNKLFQWTMPPRIILLGMITIFAIAITGYSINMSIKWWILLITLFFTFAIAIPDYLVNKNLAKAIFKIPYLFILMFLNLFRIPGTRKRFIHTEHNE